MQKTRHRLRGFVKNVKNHVILVAAQQQLVTHASKNQSTTCTWGLNAYNIVRLSIQQTKRQIQPVYTRDLYVQMVLRSMMERMVVFRWNMTVTLVILSTIPRKLVFLNQAHLGHSHSYFYRFSSASLFLEAISKTSSIRKYWRIWYV